MRFFFIVLAILLINIPVINQELPQLQLLGEPELAQDELVGVRDVNGRDCAAVQVLTDLSGLAYDAYNGVVRVDHNPGRDMVYLSPDERVLIIMHSGHEPLKLILSEIGIHLKGRQVWKIRLTGEQKLGRIPVAILSDPPGAEILIDGKSLGTGKQQTLSSGSHELRLVKDGYQPVIQRIQVDENHNLYEIKLEKEQDVLVQIDSKPGGAAVFLGEIKLGETPVSQFFPAGRYRLRLVKEWYVTYEDLVDIQLPKVAQTINLQEDFASLTVNSAPESRLTIYLNGIKQEEQTPHTFARLQPGTYRVRAQSDEYETAEENVELKRGDKKSLQLTSTANFAELTIQTHANAKVTIDGREVKQLQNIRLVPSVVLVRAELPKAQPVEERIVLHKGEKRTVELYPQVPTGTIQVAVVPYEAKVELRGDAGESFASVGGRSFSDVPVGRYTLKVSLSGYADKQETLVLKEGEKLTSSVTLEKAVAAVSQKTTAGLTTGTVTDIDGNVYKTVKIGNQWWMAENLKVKHYCNGDAIQNITNSTTWLNLEVNEDNGAWCYYKNDFSYSGTYGCLYNWYALNDSRGLAPAGWRIPYASDWQQLLDFLGGNVGGKLKEMGISHWRSPNTGATDAVGFCALPGGWRARFGYFKKLGEEAFFWSSSQYNIDEARSFGLDCKRTTIWRNLYPKGMGLSVRCVRE